MGRLLLAPLAALLVLVAAPAAQAAEQQSYAAGLTYATPAVVASQGDTLRFTNLDPVAQHDLDSDTPGLFDSGLIGAGNSELVPGIEALPPGQYAFHCSLHAWMHGVVTIAGPGNGLPSAPGAPGAPGGGGAAPNPLDLLPKVPPKPLGEGDWPFYGKDLANSRDGGPTGPSYNEAPTLAPVWSFQSSDGDFTGTPVVAAGKLVAASGGGSVFGLDASSGKQLWSKDFNEPVNGTAAIADGRVYVPLAKPGSPSLVALDLNDGHLLWRTRIDDQKNADVFGSPVVWDPGGAAPARSAPPKHINRARPRPRKCRHRAYRRKHRKRCRRRGSTHAAPAPASAATSTVYIGTSAEYGETNDPAVNVRGSVVALDAATGAVRWKTYTVPPGHDGGSVWNTPAIDASTGRLYVGTGNAYHAPSADTTDSVLAFDARTGELVDHQQGTAGDVWNGTEGAANGPDYDFGASLNLLDGPDGRKLVGGGQKSGIYWAFDRATLDPVWTATTGPGAPVVGGIVGSTASDGHHVYGPDTPAGEVWALGTGGDRAWTSSDGGPVHFSPVSVANGVVYSTDMSGHLTARESGTGVILAKLPLGAPSWGGVAIAGGYVFAVTGTQNPSGYVVAYRARG
jgi:polyvinyl alcohol dehydrogenase (cytochrome)